MDADQNQNGPAESKRSLVTWLLAYLVASYATCAITFAGRLAMGDQNLGGLAKRFLIAPIFVLYFSPRNAMAVVNGGTVSWAVIVPPVLLVVLCGVAYLLIRRLRDRPAE